MAQNKTQATGESVSTFLESIQPEQKRDDARVIDALMRRVSGEEPVMWGPSIIGYGRYHYKYDSGREGDMARISFSPRKDALTLYIVDSFPRHQALMGRLGKFKTGKSCLYLKRLADIDMTVLEELMRDSLAYMAEKYPA